MPGNIVSVNGYHEWYVGDSKLDQVLELLDEVGQPVDDEDDDEDEDPNDEDLDFDDDRESLVPVMERAFRSFIQGFVRRMRKKNEPS